MIQLQHISCTFSSGTPQETPALRDVSLLVRPHDFCVVLGPNGSGKSTLLQVIAGSIKPEQGKVVFGSHDLTRVAEYRRSSRIGRLFQNPLAGTAPDLSILENFRLAALRAQKKWMLPGIDRAFRQRVADSIRRLGMGLESRLDQPMGQLSGGQRQALTLLMATFDNCEILLMDEPVAALDPRSSDLVMNLAAQLITEKKISALLVTHRLQDALKYGNRVLFMKEGKLVYDLDDDARKKLDVVQLLKWFEHEPVA
jgi:putative ABC transport system ATP-binding protein